MKNYLLVVVLVVCSQLVFAQITIQRISDQPIDFCGEKVSFGNRVSVDGTGIAGMKISIANYRKGEDLLSFEQQTNIKGQWDENIGTLILLGNASAADYQAAIQNVEYSNLAAEPTNGTRLIVVTLDDVDYLPATGHFYQYFSRKGITWTDARAEAESKDLYGLKGYLATIRSQAENDFIRDKVKGFGWIGASDAENEGDWKWVTGPEAERTLFWRGAINGQPVNGEYSFWSSGEPNDAGDEDYGHINQNPDKVAGSWNDLENAGDGSDSQYYNPQGYYAEFGGMSGDPEVHLSAELEIHVWNIVFSGDREKTICQSEQIQLNHKYDGNYEWSPSVGLNDPTLSNPSASPMDPTVYKVISKNGTCVDSAFFTVNVKPMPSSDFNVDESSCYGYNLKVQYTGTGSDQAIYNWYFFDSLYVSEIGRQEVEIGLGFSQDNRTLGLIVNENGCVSELKEQHIKVIPDLQIEVDLDNGCEPFSANFHALTRELVSDENFTWYFGDGNSMKGKSADHIYQNDGVYDVGLRIVSDENCENYGLVEDLVTVHPVPTVAFTADAEEKSIVEPEFSFRNNSENAQSYYWDFGDSIGFSSEFEPIYRYNKMGWFDVKLIAESEFSCIDSTYHKVLVAFNQIFPPNAFSPNSSAAENQTFLPVHDGVLEAGYHLQIFNRWGERIFMAKDEFVGWDGKMKNGQFAPAGVYTWVLAYQDFIGRNHKQNGAVTLVF